MAQSLTIVNTAASASSTNIENTIKRRRAKGETTNGNGNAITKVEDSLNAYSKKKYRHVAAAHWKARTSCLDHDSDATPSFLGFRNLMVIVLGMPIATNFG